MKKLSYSGLTTKHWAILINCGVIKLAGQVCFRKDVIPIITNASSEETLETMLNNAVRTVRLPADKIV